MAKHIYPPNCKSKERFIRSTTKIMILSMLLVFALSAPTFAANPWITLTNPNPYKIWQAGSGTMVLAEPMTVWQTGRSYEVVFYYSA
jgi:hypothetical protein